MKFAIMLFVTLAVFLTSIELGYSVILPERRRERPIHVADVVTKDADGRFITFNTIYKSLTSPPPDEFIYAVKIQGYIRGLYVLQHPYYIRVKMYRDLEGFLEVKKMTPKEDDIYLVDDPIEPPPSVLLGQENEKRKWSRVSGLLLRSNSLKSSRENRESSRENGESSLKNQDAVKPQNKAKHD